MPDSLDEYTIKTTPSGQPKDRFPHFMEVPPSAATVFKHHITAAKEAHPYGAAVDVHSINDYRKMRLFMTEDKQAGYAVTPEGELNSVFSHPESRYRNVAQHAAQHAILMGGATHASAFDPVLPEMYRRGGFEVVAHTPWNEEYKPEGWDSERQGTPNVTFLAAKPTEFRRPWNADDDKKEWYVAGKKKRSDEEITGEDAYEGGMQDAKDIGENWTQPLKDTMARYPK